MSCGNVVISLCYMRIAHWLRSLACDILLESVVPYYLVHNAPVEELSSNWQEDILCARHGGKSFHWRSSVPSLINNTCGRLKYFTYSMVKSRIQAAAGKPMIFRLPSDSSCSAQRANEPQCLALLYGSFFTPTMLPFCMLSWPNKLQVQLQCDLKCCIIGLYNKNPKIDDQGC